MDILFQSRYRAASHFRRRTAQRQARGEFSFNLVIERLLISGKKLTRLLVPRKCFNLVIERLLISGYSAPIVTDILLGFNLVIERLLISG